MMLVTLEQAKAHIRTDDSTDGDADLTLKIQGASGAVLNYLKGGNRFMQALDVNGLPVVDANGLPVYTTVLLPEVQSACLLLIGYLNRDRDNDKDHGYETGYLPRPVTALLYPLRDPALA